VEKPVEKRLKSG